MSPATGRCGLLASDAATTGVFFSTRSHGGLARQIAIARREAGRRAQDVAERAGITRKTLSKTEHGDPGVAVGTVFEVATILGMPPFTGDRRELAELSGRLDDQLALLASRVRTPVQQVDDGF